MIAAIIIFFNRDMLPFGMGNEQNSDEGPQSEQPLSPQEFQDQQEQLLREMLPENTVDTDEEVQAELDALEQLQDSSGNNTGAEVNTTGSAQTDLDELERLNQETGGNYIDPEIESQLQQLQN